jgi:molybdenum cofactor cytidylyltransferase
MEARAVVLAAGESRRMGGAQKLLMPYRGRTMLEHVVEAAREWQPVIVAGVDVARSMQRGDETLIVNDAPARGMVHSLALADARVPRDEAIIVLLGDKPLVTPALIRLILAQIGDADVAYPVHPKTSQPGHPVVFSARARQKIAGLPDGDTLHALRDDPALERVRVFTEDSGAFFDVDTPDALEL